MTDAAGGVQFNDAFGGLGPILLPVMIAGVGVIASILGTFLVKIKDNNAKEAQVQKALDMGNWASIVITLIASYFLIDYMLPENNDGLFRRRNKRNPIYKCILLCNHWTICWSSNFYGYSSLYKSW